MANYFLAYIGGKPPESPEEGAKHMAKWKGWIGGLGDAVVNPGTPLGSTQSVSSNEVSDSTMGMSGFSIVTADTMDAAIEIAKSCPFLDTEGSIDVSEIREMPQ